MSTIRALCALACIVLPGIADAWELEAVGMISIPSHADYSDSAAFTIRAGGDWYGWIDYTQADQDKLTQAIADYSQLAGGIGYRSQVGRVRPYIEAGVAIVDASTHSFATREAIYYGLSGTFGFPPFVGQGRFDLLDYDYRVERAPVIRVGAQIMTSDRLALDIGYRVQRNREAYAIWSPTHNGGPVADLHACGCLWMGSGRVTMDALHVGIAYRLNL